MPPRRNFAEMSLDDESWSEWVEEEGRKLADEEFQERLKKAPAGDSRSRPLEEVMAELGLEFEDDDEDMV